MKAIVVTDQAFGTGAMKLAERIEREAAIHINDPVVEVDASGSTPTKQAWPSTWIDRHDRDRTPAIPGHEFAWHEKAVIGNPHRASFRTARLGKDVEHA